MRVLILCTGNSCRSQMAEGFIATAHPDWEVYSAGTQPADKVHPIAVSVMLEVGVDLSHSKPKLVDQYLTEKFDYVITVCDHAKETCPVFLGKVKHKLHMGFEDPDVAVGTKLEIETVFRQIRDQIQGEFKSLFDGKVKTY